VIFATSQAHFLDKADEIAILKNGQIEAQGTPDELGVLGHIKSYD
jgi:ABC-type transport system involved in cytochrome bd biosynthesis fused ATPase/permease subunit